MYSFVCTLQSFSQWGNRIANSINYTRTKWLCWSGFTYICQNTREMPYYRPQTKLRKGNVVCHSVGVGGLWCHFLPGPMLLLGGMMSLPVLSFVPSREVMVPGGLVYHTPLVQTSSGGHRGRRYASYRNTFLLNLLCCRKKYRDSYDEGNCVQGDGKRSSENYKYPSIKRHWRRQKHFELLSADGYPVGLLKYVVELLRKNFKQDCIPVG